MIQFMARFKIGIRIGVGFTVVLLLLAIEVALSYRSGSASVASLENYNRVAGNAVLIGQVDANVGQMRRLALSYLYSGDPATATAVRATRDQLTRDLDSLLQSTRAESRKERYRRLQGILADYMRNFDTLEQLRADKERLFNQDMVGPGMQAATAIGTLLGQSLSNGTMDVAARAGALQEALLSLRLNVYRYANTPKAEQAAEVERLYGVFKERHAALVPLLSGASLSALQDVSARMDRYMTAFKTFAQRGQDLHKLSMIDMPQQAKVFSDVSVEALKVAQDRMQEERVSATRSIEGNQSDSLMLGIAALVLGVSMAGVIAFGITDPIHRMARAMGKLAGGDLGTEVPALDFKDEVGEMAQAVEVFKENAQRVRQMEAEQHLAEERAAEEKRRLMNHLADSFQSSVGHVVETVSSAATELQATAQTMAAIAEETERQSEAVTVASEQASANVQTVASAAEELSSSISEIGRQVQHSSEITSRAAEKAATTHEVMKGLSTSASQIGDVVNMITDIAEQTNLLALNATIEAARAGDAGKGFAVVANEVKNLASQTGRATEEISRQIASVQLETQHAVAAIDEIVGIIEDINQVAASIASAVEQQNAATREIARNVEQAAAGTGEVSSNIQGVSQAAGEAGAASEQVVAASQELAQNAAILQQEVTSFVSRVRAS